MILDEIFREPRSPLDNDGLGYDENKNVEEDENSKPSIKNVEEECSKLLEKKNEKKAKSYAYILRRSHQDIYYKWIFNSQQY